MKNLFKYKGISILLVLVLLYTGIQAQTYGSKNSTVHILGKAKVDSSFRLPIYDTAIAAKVTGSQVYFNGVVYWYNGIKWLTSLGDITISANETLQGVLINGSDLTQDNLVNAHGNSFEWDSSTNFSVSTSDLSYSGIQSNLTLQGATALLYSQINSDTSSYIYLVGINGGMSVRGNLDSASGTAPNVVGIDDNGDWHRYAASGGSSLHFAIEDNVGIQDRYNNFEGFNLQLDSLGSLALYSGDNGSYVGEEGEITLGGHSIGLYTQADANNYSQHYIGNGSSIFNNHAISGSEGQRNSINSATNSDDDADNSIILTSDYYNNSDSKKSELFLYPDSIKIKLTDFDGTASIQKFSHPGNSTHYIPLSVSVNGGSATYADVQGNIGISTAVASADLTAQSAGTSSIATHTPSTNGTFRIGGYINVTAIVTNVITLKVTYTDINSNSVTQIIPITLAATGVIGTTATVVGNNSATDIQIRAKSGSAITVLTTATGVGSETYDVGATIERLR